MYVIEDLILESYSDPDLKKRFLENPTAMLKERGLEIPPEIILRVVEDTPEVRHIVLPYIIPNTTPTLEEIEQRASKTFI